MRYSLIGLLTVLIIGSCSTEPSPEKATNEQVGMIAHVVFFDVKDSADQEAFLAELRTLETIEVIHDMTMGAFEDLNDKRALREYEVAMEIILKNRNDYDTYQAHGTHQALKQAIGKYLAAPPAVYDYVISK